jgi:lipoate-protein ligase B
MDKQQTAVEWLIEKLESSLINTTGDYKVKLIIGLSDIEQAKEMEKEQMKGMYVEGSFAKMRYYDGLQYIDAEQYYNETYGGNK